MPVCWGGGGIGGFRSFIGGANCEWSCAIGIFCSRGGIIMDGAIFVVSKPWVVGSFGTENWTGGTSGVGWFPIVNLGWINDDVCWLLAGFNGVNADGGGWNALENVDGRIEDWINGDGKCETDVGGWRSGFNVEILFCWNNDEELLDWIWVELFGAGKRGLNGVLAELANEALNKNLY